MSDCVFCRVVAGELPSTVVLETEDAVAIRDLAPQAPTHILVVPRTHFDDVADLTSRDGALAGRLLALAVEAARADGLDNGFRLVLNTGADAGQTVQHVHVHVLGGQPLGLLG